MINWINTGVDVGGNHNVVVIMHNCYNYYLPILRNEVAQLGSENNQAIPKCWKLFDTLYLKNALKLRAHGELPALCKSLQIKVREANNPANNVKMTRDLFRKMVAAAPLNEILLAAIDKTHPIQKVVEVIKATNRLEASKIADGMPHQTQTTSTLTERAKPASRPSSAILRLISKTNSAALPTLVIFDFETTGLLSKDPNVSPPRAVQLSAYIPSVNELFDSLIDPEMSIPRETSAIHRIFDKDVAKFPRFDVVWAAFEEFITKNVENPVVMLAGYNIWVYDLEVYKSECQRTKLAQRSWKSLDVLALARSVFKGIPGIPLRGFYKQEFLAPLLGINVVGAHDAKSDVIVCSKMLSLMTKGIPAANYNQAILSKNPAASLGELCRGGNHFDAELHWELYKRAYEVTIDFAKFLFDDLCDQSYYTTSNLASLLCINVDAKDSPLYISWRIFLLLTKDIDREMVKKALQSELTLEALKELHLQDGLFSSKHYFNMHNKACENALPLAKALFSMVAEEEFFQVNSLMKRIGLSAPGVNYTAFDLKLLFLKLTAGIPQQAVDEALSSNDAINQLTALVAEVGIFYPEKFLA
jgi:DNA polymerase III epsilon subunit-like protein